MDLFIDEAVEYLALMGDSCSFDVADRVAAENGGLGRRRIGRLLGMTPAGAQQEINRAESLAREVNDA